MGWELVKIMHIGGLLNIGFVQNTNLLIAISHNGRGIFDCSSGDKIARDYKDYWEVFNEETGIVEGFEILSERRIQTYGLFAYDGLAKVTKDGWNLNLLDEEVFLFSKNKIQKYLVGDCKICELRVFGFSQDENYFAIATSCDLTIYKRNDN